MAIEYTPREQRFIDECPDGPEAGRQEVARLRQTADRFPDAPEFVRENFAALWAWEHYEDFRREAASATQRNEQVRLCNYAVRVRRAHDR